MKTIKESDMDFGGFHEKDLFHIEESELFRSLGEGIKTVEFIWLGQNKNIIFLEAKSSCPDRKNMHETPEKEKSFEKYYSSIVQKFTESLQVYLAAILNRYGARSEVGGNLKKIKDYRGVKLQFVLVIRNAETDWLAGPKAILEERLLALRKIWGIEILVLNYELAEKYNLINNT